MTICEIGGCENIYDEEIVYEEPFKPAKKAKVCRTHFTLNLILKEKSGKFNNVINVDNHRKILRAYGVID